ncbi:MAG: DUF3293 domain-containing protein [Nitrosospira sp.]|nr:DUF3293 domain-containing protein [Nitrosospira sp.]
MPESEISEELVAAYRSTDYRIESSIESGCDAFILHVDLHSEPLARLFAASGHRCAAFITACNPFSLPQSPEANLAACARLRDRLDRQLRRRATQVTQPAQAHQIIEGTGCDPSGVWPAEKSFLALGLDLEVSQAIGREFGQNAIIWCGPDAIPKLFLLR